MAFDASNFAATADKQKTVLKEEGEFERKAVPESSLRSWLSFLAIYVGRHTAGTEFTIGPLYIVHGATAIDVLLGLLIGNILAVLSWRFVVAPVANKKRYTTFYHVERICGKKLPVLYNLIASLLLAVIAGAMFAVSATAVGVLFDVPMPGLHDWYPTSQMWVIVVAFCGIFSSLTAAFGYDTVSRFSLLVTPYMVAVIAYFGYRSLQLLEVNSLSDFWTVANDKVWTGQTHGGYSKYTLWHCIFSAWFCDLMLHIGQLDLTFLRYARGANVGWCSAGGMFVGHYLTWIVAGLLYAVQLQNDPSNESVAPGPMAQRVAGWNGLICVIIAGWSTANPCLYQAGLGMQALVGDRCGTRWVTLTLGAIATCAAMFPVLVMKVLDLLAFGGLLLMPVGVVIFTDCFILPSLGFCSEFSQKMLDESGVMLTNWPAVIAWITTIAVTLPPVIVGTLAVFFAPLYGAPLAAIIYVGATYVVERKLNAAAHKAVGEVVTAAVGEVVTV